MTTPRVIYALGARMGGGDSLSSVATNAIRALEQAGYLHRALVSTYRPGSMPEALTRQVGFFHRALHRLAVMDTSGLLYSLVGLWFDAWASRQLEGGTVFHVWANHGLQSLQRAKSAGMVTITERASSHILTQNALLEEEYARYGIRYAPTPLYATIRALREYEVTQYIIVPSRFVYDSFIERGFAPERLLFLPFGIDIVRFKPAVAEPPKFRAVFAGQVSLRKGIQYLLEAWEQLNWHDAELQVIGAIAPETAELVKRYHANPTIQWVNYVPNLGDYLQQASAFVFPTIEEGSALVTYIALACGLPMITTPNAGSVVRDGQDGLLTPIRDVGALCARLEQLRADSMLRQTLRQNARRRAEEFTWARYQTGLVQHYQTITN